VQRFYRFGADHPPTLGREVVQPRNIFIDALPIEMHLQQAFGCLRAVQGRDGMSELYPAA